MIIEIHSQNDIDNLKLSNRKKPNPEVEQRVAKIVENVRERGDEALFEYIRKFDSHNPQDGIIVTDEELAEADALIPDEDKKLIEYARKRIESFHRATMPKSTLIEENGVILGNRVTACKRCGLYVPGGKAAYPSTALMTIIPAHVAGVEEIYIATPPTEGKINPYVAYIAKKLGVKTIYKMGGAHAIAALAYGTQTVKPVDVIAGPGNIYVALAKKRVFGEVGIDSVAGPSEIMVVADEEANERYVAYDLLSQAEHDELAGCHCVSTEMEKLKSIESLFMKLAQETQRNNITRISSRNAMFFFAKDLSLAAKLVDEIAPEHLELHLKEPYEFMNSIRNAGAIFIGKYSPEPMGDYIAGPNHTLPTGSTARFSSPLSAETFMKKSSIIHYAKEAFKRDAQYALKFSRIEGLIAHGDAVKVRLQNEDNKTDT